MIRSLVRVGSLLVTILVGVVCPADKPEMLNSRKAMKELSWILGTWKSTLGGRGSFEYWKDAGHDQFSGGGFSLSGIDTSFTEKLTLAANDSGLFYIADVGHNAAPTHFKMISQDSLTTTFENPTHDFPTRVIYRRLANDSLHARIEGIRKGKPAGIDFVFQRVK